MKFFIVFALMAVAAATQISNEYFPPNVGDGASYSVAASAPAPEVIYAAPSASYDTYDASASAPAHSYSDDDGYRYKTQRRRVVKTARRNRRDVSSEYLPPVAAYSAPAESYAGPAVSFETSDASASAPAHSYSDDDGYHYKTQRRRVVKTARRNRRDVSSEYLPPVAAYSAPAESYAGPAVSFETSDASASAPAHSYSDDDGYRYKTQRRRVVVRRNRF